jgi:uncharacterized protein (UPF0333 family)
MAMKKLFILVAVASLGFVACNNESATEKTEDSLANVIDSTASQAKDSVENVSDSTQNLIDSTASAKKDSVQH